jgi:LmbE family N-acetylglucosaminyl deacetylase
VPPRSRLLRERPKRAIAVYAHPDDADVSCGGTLAAWSAAGGEIDLVICAAGEKGSSDADIDITALAERRRRETLASSGVLGVGRTIFLDHADGELANDVGLRAELVEVIRGCQPEVVVCPDPLAVFFGEHYYNHRDHREVGYAALDAAVEAGMPLYHRDRGPAHRVSAVYLSGTLEPSVWVDISGSVEVKADAVGCHESQIGETGEWLRTVVRERADEAGRDAGVPFAESFRCLRLA